MRTDFHLPLIAFCLFLHSASYCQPDNPSLDYWRHGSALSFPSTNALDEEPPIFGDSLFETVGRWKWGNCYALDAVSHHVGIGNGSLFQMVDVSNPSQPVVVWEDDLSGGIVKIIFRDSLAYVFGNGKLFIYSIQQPDQPDRLAELPIGVVFNAALVEDLMFVTGFNGLVFVIDVSDPSSPYVREVGSVPVTLPRAVAAYDRSVYVGGSSDVFTWRIDFSNLDSIFIQMVWTIGSTSLTLFATDTHLLQGRGEYLVAYSLADVDSPLFLGQTTLSGTILEITVQGSIAYCLTSDANVYAVDISMPGNLSVLGSVTSSEPVTRSGSAIAVVDTVVFSSFSSALFIAGTTDPTAMSQLAFFPTGHAVEGVAIRGNLAFTAAGRAGLWVLDISDPAHPEPVSNIQSGGYGFGIALKEGTALIVNVGDGAFGGTPDPLEGLWLVDISNPTSLTSIGFCHIPGALSVAVWGSYAFVSKRSAALTDTMLLVYDISEPASPVLTGSVIGRSQAYRIIARENHLLAAASGHSGGGLKIIDWSTPSAPFILSSTLPTALGILDVGDTIFVDKADSIIVLDISDPINPIRIGGLRRGFGSFSGLISLVRIGSVLIWAASSWMGAVDISDPTLPSHIGYQPATTATSLTLLDSMLVLGNGIDGMSLMYMRGPTGVKGGEVAMAVDGISLATYPNPFNAQTSIEFQLLKSQHVRLEVVDVLGRSIQVLKNERLEAGTHRAVFDGTSVASGVYFVTLASLGNPIARKILLLR